MDCVRGSKGGGSFDIRLDLFWCSFLEFLEFPFWSFSSESSGGTFFGSSGVPFLNLFENTSWIFRISEKIPSPTSQSRRGRLEFRGTLTLEVWFTFAHTRLIIWKIDLSFQPLYCLNYVYLCQRSRLRRLGRIICSLMPKRGQRVRKGKSPWEHTNLCVYIPVSLHSKFKHKNSERVWSRAWISILKGS